MNRYTITLLSIMLALAIFCLAASLMIDDPFEGREPFSWIPPHA